MTSTTTADLIHGRDIAEELAALAASQPDRLYGTEGERRLTVTDLDWHADQVAAILADAGVSPGARVAVSLPNTALHVAVVFALVRLGVLWIPLNTKLNGVPLTHLLRDSGATHLIADDGSDIATAVNVDRQEQHGLELGTATVLPDRVEASTRLWRCDSGGVYPDPVPDTTLLMYTSGTTGPPKGVRVSQTMWRAAAAGAMEVTDVRTGDVLYLWEPIFHIGGAQTLLVPLYAEASLALTRQFSASRFWSEVSRSGATHIHYLGGMLQILLQQPASEDERNHRVRVAWGAGATPAMWQECQDRFGFALHECYGMTETSSITTVNRGMPGEGVGTPLPWFDVRIDGQDEPVAGTVGEILVRSKVPGLLTAGYLDNEEATRKSRDGDWFRTGDHGQWDDAGHLHFHGRASDSIRVRGENISAWQVENVYARHPDVDRCAVVGVPAYIGEQEMMLIVTPVDGRAVDPHEIVNWGAGHLAKFQVPRYIKVLDRMPLTPSQRVAKHQLPKGLADATDCSCTEG